MAEFTMNGTDPPNPMGTDGIEFIEFATTQPEALGAWFERMGFALVARHRSKQVMLYRQGDINFIVNAEAESLAQTGEQDQSAAISAVAFRVRNAAEAYQTAVSLGAWEMPTQAGVMELNIPAIQGIGETVIYFVDRYGTGSIYDVDFQGLPAADWNPAGIGLLEIERIIHSVAPGRTQQWTDFYADMFGFGESAAVAGGDPGTAQRLVTSPCGKIRMLLEERLGHAQSVAPSALPASAERIAGVALTARDLPTALQALRANGINPATAVGVIATVPLSRVVVHGIDFDIVQAEMADGFEARP